MTCKKLYVHSVNSQYAASVVRVCVFGSACRLPKFCLVLQSFSAVDRLLWAARIHVDRVNFSFEGGLDTLPLSPETESIEVTPYLCLKA